QWGTCTLEAYLKQKFPNLRILRIDSESLSEPSHPAYGCMTSLDRVLANYDVVLASPAIETGVSIDIRGHFTSVWGIAQGVQSENSVRQALGRIRENLPRFIWVAPYGFNQVGNGSTSIPSLLTSGQSLTQLNVRLLQQSDFDALDDIETSFQAESLMCWAKMAVRHNASMAQYRESVLAALKAEGHQVIEAASVDFSLENAVDGSSASSSQSPSGALPHPEGTSGCQRHPIPNPQSPLQDAPETNSLTAIIAAVRDQNYQAECEAIAQSEDLTENEYRTLQRRLVKTTAQRRAKRKHDLKQRYGIPVTAQLVAQDDAGWYTKLQLHYFLTVGREYLAQRDAACAQMLIDLGDGSIFLPDFNRSQLGAAVGTMELLGVPVLLQSERELRSTDEDLRAMAALALSNRAALKTTLGMGLAKNATPITIVRRLLEKIGYGVRCIGRTRQASCTKAAPAKGIAQSRVRVYQVVNPDDGRFEVFKYWLAMDGKFSTMQPSWQDSSSSLTKNANLAVDLEEVEYVQLCLL
ncbi:MAG: bifunctional DNA primase/helicase, partial [Microcoleus sp. SIO2G3]|nr:bifunctional DNA primase/helicase [Microcoleus sp. SIO2G3]